MRNLFFVLAIFFIWGCGSGSGLRKMLEINSKIATELGAKNCQITFSKSTDTNHGKSEQTIITIDGLAEKFQKEKRVKMASLAVMIFYQNWNPKDTLRYEDTKVEINVGTDHYERLFTKSEIKRVFRIFGSINKFFEMGRESDFSSYRELIDTAYISESGFTNIKNVILSIDSADGKIDKVVVTGFAADKIKDSEEPLTAIWAEAFNGNKFSKYRFYFLNKNEKLVFIGINEPEEK